MCREPAIALLVSPVYLFRGCCSRKERSGGFLQDRGAASFLHLTVLVEARKKGLVKCDANSLHLLDSTVTR